MGTGPLVSAFRSCCYRPTHDNDISRVYAGYCLECISDKDTSPCMRSRDQQVMNELRLVLLLHYALTYGFRARHSEKKGRFVNTYTCALGN